MPAAESIVELLEQFYGRTETVYVGHADANPARYLASCGQLLSISHRSEASFQAAGSHQLAGTRKQLGLGQKQIAAAMGVSTTRVSQIEHDEVTSVEVLARCPLRQP
jgi:DNA-binding XRE family transcriptional regulator